MSVLPTSRSGVLGLNRSRGGGLSLWFDRRYAFLAMMFLFVVFDYRRSSQDESSLIVIILGVGSVASGFLCLSSLRKINRTSLFMAGSVFLFLSVATLSGVLFHDQGIYPVLARAVPVIAFAVSILCVASVPRTAGELKTVVNVILYMAILSCIWKLAFGFIYYGLSIQAIRYQIISGALPALLSFSIASFFVQRRKWGLFALVLSMIVILLSVTRTYIAVAFASAAVSFICLPIRLWTNKSGAVLLFLFATFVILIVTVSVDNQIVDRWVDRLTVSDRFGFDLTGASRTAQNQYMLDRLWSEPSGLLIGFGLDAESSYGGQAGRLFYTALGISDEAHSRGFGHNVYISLIYLGGVFFGGALILLLILNFISAIRCLRKYLAFFPPDDLAFTLFFGISSAAGYGMIGVLSGPFGDRTSSIYYGASIGLCCASQNFVRSTIRKING